jgi:TonB family protein
MILRAATFLGLCSTAALAFAGDLPPPPEPNGLGRVLVTWSASEAQCGGAPIAIGPLVRRPLNNLAWSTQPNLKPLTYRFEVDAAGRPLSIERIGSDFVPYSDDLAPALAASQFAGGAKASCQITYTPKTMSLAEAPIGDLISYTISPIGGALPREGWARIKPAGDCAKAGLVAPLLSAFPDYARIPGTPGIHEWALVGYDIDRQGKPTKVHIISSNGNAALAKASAKAMQGWKFADGPRTGCIYAYRRNPLTLAAPPAPEEAPFHPADATCEEPHKWTRPLSLQFPENYRRRMIEGWAVVRYDVAPWGAVGNLKVLASQPSEDFGKQAVIMLQNAAMPASSRGMTGCVDRVRYVLDHNAPPAE